MGLNLKPSTIAKIKAWQQRGRKPIKAGKRTLKRQAMNRRLNKLGIDQCEIRMPKVCTPHFGLTWAHATKSRYLVTDEDWMRAARCCLPCHMLIEAMSHEAMFLIVTKAIAKRDTESL